MKEHTAKELATYVAKHLSRWTVALGGSKFYHVWASSKGQAIAMAEQKYRAETGFNVVLPENSAWRA